MVPIRVLIADAQMLFADALAIALEQSEERIEVLADRPTTGIDTVKAAIRIKPDITLADYWLLGMVGPALVRALAVQVPDTKVIHLSWFHGPPQIEGSLASGAVGFLPKSVRVELVVEAVHRAHAGECPVFEEQIVGLVSTISHRQEHLTRVAERLATLTPRQLEILRLLGAGLMVNDVAKRLGLSLGTVRTHIHNILEKSGARSQMEVVALARDQGLLP